MLQRIAATMATATAVVTLLTPVAFAQTVEVSGNGTKSENSVVVAPVSTTSVQQTNNTNVTTNVNAVAKTGGNKANGNTGDGDVSINTGDATNDVTVVVVGGMNEANVPAPCGCVSDVAVTVSDNGKKSTNSVVVTPVTAQTVTQKNKTKAKTKATVKAKTGKNKANNNTGSGTVDVTTGEAENTVEVAVEGSSNTL